MNSAASWSLVGMFIVLALFAAWVLMRMAAISDKQAAELRKAWELYDQEDEEREERVEEIDYRVAERGSFDDARDLLAWNREMQSRDDVP